jgi:hypothetical protein
MIMTMLENGLLFGEECMGLEELHESFGKL